MQPSHRHRPRSAPVQKMSDVVVVKFLNDLTSLFNSTAKLTMLTIAVVDRPAMGGELDPLALG